MLPRPASTSIRKRSESPDARRARAASGPAAGAASRARWLEGRRAPGERPIRRWCSIFHCQPASASHYSALTAAGRRPISCGHLMATTESPTSPTPVSFETAPDRYRHWKLDVRRPGRDARRWTCRRTPACAGLPPEAQLLRPRRRHRARRRDPAHPLRASRSARRRRHEPEGAHLLRRREHLHAARLDARVQGELLQVHERDAARRSRTRARTRASSSWPR